MYGTNYMMNVAACTHKAPVVDIASDPSAPVYAAKSLSHNVDELDGDSGPHVS